jgi:uncharacterized protein (DUF1330 family)
MNSKYKIGTAIIASFVFGVCAAGILKAQSKPAGFLFVEIDVKDKDGYAKDFLPKAQANIKAFGGKYIAGGFDKAILLSGSPIPNRVLIFQYPDMDAIKAFNEKEQQLEADVGSKYATFRAVAVEGIEQK